MRCVDSSYSVFPEVSQMISQLVAQIMQHCYSGNAGCWEPRKCWSLSSQPEITEDPECYASHEGRWLQRGRWKSCSPFTVHRQSPLHEVGWLFLMTLFFQWADWKTHQTRECSMQLWCPLEGHYKQCKYLRAIAVGIVSSDCRLRVKVIQNHSGSAGELTMVGQVCISNTQWQLSPYIYFYIPFEKDFKICKFVIRSQDLPILLWMLLWILLQFIHV